jgi:hypothetical protein
MRLLWRLRLLRRLWLPEEALMEDPAEVDSKMEPDINKGSG